MPFLAPVAAAVIGGGFVTQLLVGTALTIGGTLLSQALAPKPPAQIDPGVSLTMRLGGDTPLSFFVGTSATAGHRTYAGAWGQDGQTPNAYFVDVLELANAPLDGLNDVYVSGERGTIRWSQPHPEFGYPIDQGRKDGKDHLWVKFHDGRQAVADPYLRAKFGNHPERPYGADMVGRGTPYAIVTTRYNRELWQGGAPSMLFEVRGLRLYDIRKDSSAGGVGPHRRNNPATWEWTDNPYVIAYNVAFMGVYVGEEWLWGLQNLPALRLPTSAWIAAMNEADRTLSAWGNQKQFTIGGEITVDMEPANVLEEIAKSSMGRFIESAGSYKPRCGAPGTSVWSFGESELLITEPRTITPFPGLEATHNYVEVSYSEPGEAWGPKPAPAQTNAAYVTADGNRKLAVGLRLPMVNRNEQAQRLGYSYLEDGRRFRMLEGSFHPITWLLEPGDVIDGTILSEGYNGKAFEILEMSGRRTFVQTMTLREIDPADFDPPASARQPWSVGPIQTIYPPAQPATGVSFAPYEFFDDQARARRPGIEGFYQGGMDDIEYFEVQVRKPGNLLPFFEGRYEYQGEVGGEASQPIFSTSFLPGSAVEVRGRYRPYSARETAWATWMAVTLPNIKLTSLDVEIDEIAAEVRESVGELLGPVQDDAREALERIREAFQEDGAASASAYLDRQKIRVELTSVTGQARADAAASLLAATGPDSALAIGLLELRAEVYDPVSGLPAVSEATRALETRVDTVDGQLNAQTQLIDLLEVSYADVSASGLFSVDLRAAPSGVSSRIALTSKATAGGQSAAAAAMLDARMVNGVLTSELLLVANRVALVATDAQGAPKRGLLVVQGDDVLIDLARIRGLTAGNIAANSITGNEIAAQTIRTENIIIGGLTGNTTASAQETDQVNTTSTGWVDMPGMSFTLSVAASASVLILFQANVWNNTDGRSVDTRILMDGAEVLPGLASRHTSTFDGVVGNNVGIGVIDPSPGNHTFRVQWRVTAGAGRATSRRLVGYQFKR